MYLQILKKDLRRKKTMNIILLIFIILAATFIACSANNMVSVTTALDSFFDKAEVPDYWFCTKGKKEVEKYEHFAKENQYDFRQQVFIQIDPKNVKVNTGKREGEKFQYSNSVCMSQLKDSAKLFDKNDKVIEEVKKGEIYLTADLFHNSPNHFKIGDEITITDSGKTRTFHIKGSMKDAMFGSSMLGKTKFLVSGEDYRYFNEENAGKFYSVMTYTEDGKFLERFNKLELNMFFSVNRSGLRVLYIMDMVTAAVMLVVSICLILISMVILRFTINFTMSEEFREIGVMKAIGICNPKIRGLYITKYFAVSMVGGITGFFLSIPFGKLLLQKLSQNIILPGSSNYFINLVCAFSVVVIVLLFCYFCTGKIKRFSPIDAIRNGENGERYSRKGIIHLNKSRFPAVLFLACNDILSNIRRFAAMLVIFTLGILLIIIPINTINTLKSDKLLSWFSMAECDHVISMEQLLNTDSNNLALVEDTLEEVKGKLSGKGIKADVFQEIMFRMNISYKGKRMSSLSNQGVGGVTTDMYTYLEGSAPQNNNEVGISHIVSDTVGAKIGDTVVIRNGETERQYMVTAIYQTMNNMGEGIRFYQEEELDYTYAAGSFGIQIKYKDNPDKKELEERKEILKDFFPDVKVFTPGEYVGHMIGGDVITKIQDIKYLILAIILCINTLVTVLMVKSFLTKEKGEIAMLKALGFQNISLVVWQALRIGLILFFATILATLFSTPLSQVSIGPVFRIMGAQNITFEIIPLEVYVLYPLVVLCVTILAGIMTATQIRKISTSEASRAE